MRLSPLSRRNLSIAAILYRRSGTLHFASTCPRAADLTASMRAWQHVKRTRRRKTSTARQTRIRARRVHGNSLHHNFGMGSQMSSAKPGLLAGLCAFNSSPPNIRLASFRTRSKTMEARIDNYKDLKLKLDGLVPPGHGFHRNLLFDALTVRFPVIRM